MNVALFNAKRYDRRFFEAANEDHRHDITYVEAHLDETTAPIAKGFDAVCAFVNDQLNEPVLQKLTAGGTHYIALRCSGFNNVDLAAAERLGLKVARVPAYSPSAVAEHVVALLLTMYRKTHRAHNRVREQNFSLEGLLGTDLHGKTATVVGAGAMGRWFGECLADAAEGTVAFADRDPAVAAAAADGIDVARTADLAGDEREKDSW